MIKVREAARDMVVIVDEARELGEDPMPAALRFIDDLVDEGERDRLHALDEAWEQINAIGGADEPGNEFARGVNSAVGHALTCLEDLGAKNPATRRAGK